MKENNLNCKEKDHLYDPDIASIVMIILTGLSTLCNIVTTTILLKKQRYDINDKQPINDERKKNVALRIKYSLRDISFSTNNIRQRLENILEFCLSSLDNREEFFNRNFIFGNNPFSIYEYQFEIYQTEKDFIFNEIYKISNNVSFLEKLISENHFLVENEYNLKIMQFVNNLNKIVNRINELMKDFGKTTINDFINRTLDLCRDIEEICNSYLKLNL